MEPRITIVTLGVRDLEASIRFYRDGLGLPLRDRYPDAAFFSPPLTRFRTVWTVLEWRSSNIKARRKRPRSCLPCWRMRRRDVRPSSRAMGRSVAALVPVKGVAGSRQMPLTALAGSGKGMWGDDSKAAVRRLRDEWVD